MLELLLVGDGPRPQGERYAVVGPRKISPQECVRAPLGSTQLNEFLDHLLARGVQLYWGKGDLVLYWPVVETWPFRDALAWSDVERVQVNFDALLAKYKLKAASDTLALNTPLLSVPWVFCDVETTGRDPYKDRVCEVSLCRVEPGKPPEWFSSLIHPGRKIKNSDVHKITDKMVKNESRFETLASKIKEMVSNAVFISHQTNYFDERFIAEELARCDLHWQPSAKLSTLTMAQSLLDRASYKLPDLAASLQLPAPQSHRAESDVKTMMALWDILYVRAKERNPIPETIGDFISL